MTILIVEDNREYKNVLGEVLLLGGHRILTSENGEEALEVLKHSQVDLIVSDIRMPKCTGKQLHDLVRRDFRLRKLPFVYITADPALRVGTRLDSTGCDYMVPKVPFERLLNTIDEISQN